MRDRHAGLVDVAVYSILAEQLHAAGWCGGEPECRQQHRLRRLYGDRRPNPAVHDRQPVTPPGAGHDDRLLEELGVGANSSGNKKPVLDQTLAAATPPGIKVGKFYLTAGQCGYAVNLLNKSTMKGGVKMASDPLFNMTAQLVAAELNIAAGAGTCGKVTTAITQANALLSAYNFNGDTYSPKLSKADTTLANNLATELDLFNNDNPKACL